jgi:hypothetical protein
MGYLRDLWRVLSLDGSVYTELHARNRALGVCVAHVALLGLVYGAASARFGRQVLAAGGDPTAAFNPLFIVLMGVSLAFLMHAGGALFIWVFCRGLGGCAVFMPPYLNLGIAAAAAWPLAPALAALQAGGAPPWLAAVVWLLAGYAALAAFVGVRAAARLTPLRMALAAVATLIYIACFLYLWV